MNGVWPFLGGFLGLVILVIWGITIWDIVKSHLGAGKTAAWMIIVILLPLVGSAAYWILRKPEAGDAQRQYDNEMAMRQSRHDRSFDSTSYNP